MNKCIESGKPTKPFKRGRNGTRNNQMKKGWGSVRGPLSTLSTAGWGNK